MQNYAWESATGGRSWEQLEEDQDGLKVNDDVALEKKNQDRLASKPSIPQDVRRGIIRHLCLCVDLSVANNKAMDYRPSRMELIYRSILDFINGFFDVNPLSQMMIVVTKDQKAHIISPMSSSPRDHSDNIKEAISQDPTGQPSVQRALELAFSRLKHVPEYAQKELLYLASALGTSDHGNIHDTVDDLSHDKVRCSVIGMGGEVYILRQLADMTGGTHHIAMQSQHYSVLINAHKIPPALEKDKMSNLAHPMKVGFPQKIDGSKWDIDPKTKCIFNGGYECPRCKTRNDGTLPLECNVCGLNLLYSPHIARSYHHLIKVPAFVKIDKEDGKASSACYCCNTTLLASRDLRYRCQKCGSMYAAACVDFVTEHLFNCAGCLRIEGVDNEKNEKDQEDGVGASSGSRKRSRDDAD
jgi:transcription initiation factor TFIIH subunit 2